MSFPGTNHTGRMDVTPTYPEGSIGHRLVTLLTEDGLWPDEAEAVLKVVVEAEDQQPMEGRWRDRVTDYPKPLLAVLWMRVREEAVNWIDANKPKHWARPMFTNSPVPKPSPEEPT